jgi:hypothetical protein
MARTCHRTPLCTLSVITVGARKPTGEKSAVLDIVLSVVPEPDAHFGAIPIAAHLGKRV